jgi:rubredoxin
MELVRCKACGYITAEKKLGKVCPACGLPRTVFEPHKETMSEKRKRILDLNLHPIAVHFPQSFSVFIAFLILLSLVVPRPIEFVLMNTVTVLALFLPLTLIPAAAAGLIDGKIRFKKVTTPHLVTKMIAGGVFFVLSVLMAVAAFHYGTIYPGKLYIFILSLGCIACQVVLGEIGKTLLNAKLPG